MPDSSELKVIEVACEGGLMLDRTSQSIPWGAATVLQNYEPSVNGGYRRISGFAKFSTTAVTGTGAILGITFLGNKAVVCRGPNVMHGTGGVWTSITTGRTSAGAYHFDKYNWNGTETIVMVDGVNYAATWDGTNYALLNGAVGTGAGTAPTAPTDVEEFKGYLFFAQSNMLTFTAPYSANDFTPASGAGSIIIPDTIVAIKTFRSDLYVFCKNTIFKISGTSVSDFNFTPVTKNIGCVSKHSIQEIGGDLIFLAPDGLRTISGTMRIGDVELGTISEHIKGRIYGLDETAYTISSMVIRNKNQYRMWFAAGSTAESDSKGVIAVLRNIVGATSKEANPDDRRSLEPESIYGPHWNFADIVGIKPAYAASGFIGNIEYYLHGGYSDGIIYKQESGNDFNGASVAYVFRTPDLSFGDMGIRKKMKRILISILYEGTVAPSINMIYDFGSVLVNQPMTYSMSFPSTLAIYGTSVYGVATYTLNSEALSRIWMQGSGFTASMLISGTDTNSPFTIRGFQMEASLGGRK